ncbi:hypothetical protein BU17DRAFT_95885 [Hysterangium stoloniferum]|nr:hypothetical protein BU17DRAFT_95885 [Hysterangium stoloniferum]
MSGIALDKSGLLAIFIESVLWGLFLASYMITLYLLFQKKHSHSKHALYAAFVSLLFVLGTMHVAVSFARLLRAFFPNLKPVEYLMDITNSLFRLKYGVLFLQIFLGDLLIISRCFLLWNKNYMVVIGPIVMATGTLVSAAGALNAMVVIARTDVAFDNPVQHWITASYTLALATKLVCFALVVFRVRQIHSLITTNVNRHVTVYTLMVVLVESGMCSLIVSLILLPSFVANSNAHYIICDALSPITGITVTAIIAGITINLSNPSPPQLPVTAARPAWNRYSIGRTPTSPRVPKSQWNESDDDIPPSPIVSDAAGMHHLNKSTGTLNMGIVI